MKIARLGKVIIDHLLVGRTGLTLHGLVSQEMGEIGIVLPFS